jgi:phage gp46-like protein
MLAAAYISVQESSLEQQASQQASSSWQCCSLQAAYRAALLQYGHTPADLQQVISTYAAAVLRVSQGLGSRAGHLLQQCAFSAAEQVHNQLASLQRDQQLLAVAKEALAYAAAPAACLVEHAAAQQTAAQHQAPNRVQDPVQQQLQEHAGLSWKQTLQQMITSGFAEDGNEWPVLLATSSSCFSGAGQASS